VADERKEYDYLRKSDTIHVAELRPAQWPKPGRTYNNGLHVDV
jgi:hypothetical protein